jgi:GH24 family phage-related lysozyme (muramidase)
MKITSKQLKKIIREELIKEAADRVAGGDVADAYSLDDLKDNAKVIDSSKLVHSEEAIKLLKKYEGFRKRIYDDEKPTKESTGPWITSFGWDPITGEMIPPDPISGRLGGDDFNIKTFHSPYPPRMSITNGVPTVGYGFALNDTDKIRKWSKHLGGSGAAWEPVFGGNAAGPDGESSQTMSEKRDMTVAEADAILEEILPKYGRRVRAQLKVPITQDQFDALVSRAYNEGAGGASVRAAIDELNKNTGKSWEAAANVGSFNLDKDRAKAEKAKMLKWITV